ncbi:hypothetical protein [Gloeothece verrucosa]|nr:hypothetical protein [Gloeothece verrucosa]
MPWAGFPTKAQLPPKSFPPSVGSESITPTVANGHQSVKRG